MATTNLALVGISSDDAGVASAVVNTTQQIGGSLGTALLSTVAFTSGAKYIAERARSADEVQILLPEGTVHGFGVGYFWATGFFLVGAVIALVMITAKKEDIPSNAGAAHMG
jgi:hypothetical protein